MITIAESGMNFGPLKESNLYHIETAPEYRRIQQGTKIAEFIFWKESKKRLVVLEAKSSLADFHNSDAFKIQIGYICDKFLNSLDLYLSSALRRKLPPHMEKIDYNEVEFRFILVIRGYDEDGLMRVKDAIATRLDQSLRLQKIWTYTICAINEYQARSRGMLAEDSQTVGSVSFWE